MRKAWATSALTLTIIIVALFSNVRLVSAVAFGNATRIFPNQIFDVFGFSSYPSGSPSGRLYSGTGCVSSNLLQTQGNLLVVPPVYVIAFGGEPAGSYSVQVDGDLNIGNPIGCVPFTILPLPTTTVTVTNTVTAATTVTVATTVTLFTSALA